MNVNNQYVVNQMWSNGQKSYASPSISEEKVKAVDSTFDKVANKYDMNNISPREIDKFVEELRGTGMEWDFDTVGLLATRGAKWRSNLANLTKGLNEGRAAFDPDKRIDLIATIESNIEFNKQSGFDQEHYSTLLKFVKSADIRSVLPTKGLIA